MYTNRDGVHPSPQPSGHLRSIPGRLLPTDGWLSASCSFVSSQGTDGPIQWIKKPIPQMQPKCSQVFEMDGILLPISNPYRSYIGFNMSRWHSIYSTGDTASNGLTGIGTDRFGYRTDLNCAPKRVRCSSTVTVDAAVYSFCSKLRSYILRLWCNNI